VLQSPNVTLTQDMGDLVEDKTLPPMLSQVASPPFLCVNSEADCVKGT